MKDKAPLVCDVQMVQAGISKVRLEKFGMPILCPIGDADVAEAAKAAGHTRAIEAIRKVKRMGNGGVLAIGNAPTALTEAIRLVKEEGWRPHLIIGVPVGFVSAAESKDSLAAGDADPVPYITCVGRKGGTPAAVSAVNALLLMVEGGSPGEGMSPFDKAQGRLSERLRDIEAAGQIPPATRLLRLRPRASRLQQNEAYWSVAEPLEAILSAGEAL